MFAITGITGQVGGAVAKTLLERGRSIRAVVRDVAKGEAWAKLGAEVAIADFLDVASLRAAFEGTEGVFAMIPPYFAPSPGFSEARSIIKALGFALEGSGTPKVVALSSIGSQRTEKLGLITQTHILETEFGRLPMPVAFLRAGSFMENARWVVDSARNTGTIPSFYAPADRLVPMIATDDIGRIGAETLLESWAGRRVLEIEAARRYTPDDLAGAFSVALGRTVEAVAVPRDRWETLPEGQRPSPAAIEMYDGFNSGWIDFEGGDLVEHVLGRINLDQAVSRMVLPSSL